MSELSSEQPFNYSTEATPDFIDWAAEAWERVRRLRELRGESTLAPPDQPLETSLHNWQWRSYVVGGNKLTAHLSPMEGDGSRVSSYTMRLQYDPTGQQLTGHHTGSWGGLTLPEWQASLQQSFEAALAATLQAELIAHWRHLLAHRTDEQKMAAARNASKIYDICQRLLVGQPAMTRGDYETLSFSFEDLTVKTEREMPPLPKWPALRRVLGIQLKPTPEPRLITIQAGMSHFMLWRDAGGGASLELSTHSNDPHILAAETFTNPAQLRYEADLLARLTALG